MPGGLTEALKRQVLDSSPVRTDVANTKELAADRVALQNDPVVKRS